MQLFPAKISVDGSGFLATFRDIPAARTWAGSREAVIEAVQDALISAMEFYIDGGQPVPLPSRPERGEVMVDLPASVVAKVLLLNEMIACRVGRSEMARRLRTTLQAVNGIIDLRRATKIEAIDDALGTLGKRLVLSAV